MRNFFVERKKFEGYVLLETVLAMIAFSMLSMAFFTIFSGQFSMINSSRDALQAQQYAEIDAQKLRLMNYYDLDDEGAKSRSAMTSWENPNGTWEDEISIGSEIVVDDYNQSKQRIASIKIYRTGDTLPRFSMEVPISSQGSGVPIGSIIAWGVDSNPSYDGGTYLECDGSTFDKNKYKRLYDVLGTDKLPNYQGLFLRGYGSQNFSQVNGKFFDSNNPKNITNGSETSTTYSSGNLGKIQGDAVRNSNWRSATGLFFSDELDEHYPLHITTDNRGFKWFLYKGDNGYESSAMTYLKSKYFSFIFSKPKHYRYRPVMSSFSTEEGTFSFVSGLEEYTSEAETDEGFSREVYESNMGGGLFFDLPTANEIRPANVAVKFMIKAK